MTTAPVSWLAAEQACLQDDAELARYDSIPAEVRQFLPQDAMWVTQASADQGFTWLDGTAVSRKYMYMQQILESTSVAKKTMCT